MKIYRDISQLPSFNNSVLTIGSFDGVHRGHQRLLSRVQEYARQIDGISVIITFHPHPRKIIYPRDQSLKVLTTLDEKIELFRKYGVQHCVIVPFTVEFSQMPPREYVENFLIAKFNPRYIIIGYDHRFGLNRSGDMNLLKSYEKNGELEIIEIDKQTVDEIVVSSTKIRNALLAGDISLANRLMNHHYRLSGKIVHGQKIGNTLGYPTANIQLEEKEKLVPKVGVYSCFVEVEGVKYQGMLYIGDRPVLKHHNHQVIELHIFDFDEFIYNQNVTVELVTFIRPEQSFQDLDKLQIQLAEDETTTRIQLENYQESFSEIGEDVLAVVILNYNGKEHLKTFLPSVINYTPKDYVIYVIDNGSTDESISFIKNHFPSVKLVSLRKNLGFAGGYNEGLRQIDATYYLLLNSDIMVTANWINPLIHALDSQPDVAIVQPKILSYHEKDRFEYAGGAGGWMDITGYPFCMGRILNEVEVDQGQYDNSTSLFWASGAAFLIRANIYNELQGFDADYFAHHEEIDLCWRIKRSGYNILSIPQSVVYHLGGGTLEYSSPQKVYLNFRNNLLTILKNESKSKLIWLLPVRFCLDLLAAFHYVFKGSFTNMWQVFRAYGHFIVAIPKTIRKRKRYNLLIRSMAISDHPNTEGFYRGSILWDHYIKGSRSFHQLDTSFKQVQYESQN